MIAVYQPAPNKFFNWNWIVEVYELFKHFKSGNIQQEVYYTWLFPEMAADIESISLVFQTGLHTYWYEENYIQTLASKPVSTKSKANLKKLSCVSHEKPWPYRCLWLLNIIALKGLLFSPWLVHEIYVAITSTMIFWKESTSCLVA